MVCCWRTMKEVSLVFGTLCANVLPALEPLAGDNAGDDANYARCKSRSEGLQDDALAGRVRVFLELLLKTRHRGAVDLLHVGFSQMCSAFSRSASPLLRQLSLSMLRDQVAELKNTTSASSITRRSAGIPLVFQAVLCSLDEASMQSESVILMEELLQLAQATAHALSHCSEPAPGMLSSCVHAFNTIRFLMRDARIGPLLSQSYAAAVQIAIAGFSHEQFAVRNSAMMLFTVLLRRGFGAKHNHNEAGATSVTGRAFFARHPSLHPFLLSRLQIATEAAVSAKTSHLHPELHPILTFLSKLQPAAFHKSSSREPLLDFLPLVEACSASCIMHARIMASRAYAALVPASDRLASCKSMLAALESSAVQSSRIGQNNMHGKLLILGELLSDDFLPTIDPVELHGLLELATSASWLGFHENPCPLTRCAFLLVLQRFVPLTLEWDERPVLCGRLHATLVSDDSAHRHLPWWSLYRQVAVRLWSSLLVLGRSATSLLPADAVAAASAVIIGVFAHDSADARVEAAKVAAELGLLTATSEQRKAVLDIVLEQLKDEKSTDCVAQCLASATILAPPTSSVRRCPTGWLMFAVWSAHMLRALFAACPCPRDYPYSQPQPAGVACHCRTDWLDEVSRRGCRVGSGARSVGRDPQNAPL
eukprot:m.94985 g.94985  ORF g.94985 m.94985 type:complete len:651 (-) comp8728_c0_seq2:992-2944(-)